ALRGGSLRHFRDRGGFSARRSALPCPAPVGFSRRLLISRLQGSSAMPITLGCTSCGKRFRARDESAGKKVKCPYCQAAVQVPTPEESDNAAAPTASVPVPPASTAAPRPGPPAPPKSGPVPAAPGRPAPRPSPPPAPAPVAD